MRRYIIYTYQFTHSSAGWRVLYYLGELLHDAGYDCYFAFAPYNPTWFQLAIHPEERPSKVPEWDGILHDSDIVIYPETFHGNPLKAKNIVRYVMYFPQVYGKNIHYPSTELVILYESWLINACQGNWDFPLNESYVFSIPSIEEDLFVPLEKTIDAVWYMGKGSEGYPSKHVPDGALQITWNRPATRQGLATLLGKTKRFFCYDRYTVMMDEAMLAGCEAYLVNKDKLERFHLGGTRKPMLRNKKRDLTFAHRLIKLVQIHFGDE